MEEKMLSLQKNVNLKLVDLPKNKIQHYNGWLYRIKYNNASGEVDCFKVRLVIKLYASIWCRFLKIIYTGIKYYSIRLILIIAAAR